SNWAALNTAAPAKALSAPPTRPMPLARSSRSTLAFFPDLPICSVFWAASSASCLYLSTRRRSRTPMARMPATDSPPSRSVDPLALVDHPRGLGMGSVLVGRLGQRQAFQAHHR